MNLTKKMPYLLLLAFLVLIPGAACAATHVVSPGESLYKIGLRYGVSAQRIMDINGLKSSNINPGQKLYIEDKIKYKVVPGDSLYKIARKFGLTTEQLMSENGLSGSDIYPGQLLTVVNKANKTVQPAVSRGNGNITRNDFDLLARIISAEADSESYETKVAVGAVVLNRTRSGLFPDTIPGVVYQVDNGRYQFEPVLNGWIKQPASTSAQKAAKDALNGWDPTNGALYFFESWVPNKFLQARPVSRVMDSFTFSY